MNLLSRALAPTSYLLRYATGAHQPVERLSAPDQGADQEPNWPVEINLIPFTLDHIVDITVENITDVFYL